MKLLDKFEVQKSKALDKKREIDEGVKLAKKVDVLRETVSKEQANLIKFRDESIAKVREEIALSIAEKDKLQKEILELQSVKDKMMVPLEKGWDELRQQKKELALAQNSLKETVESIKETEAHSIYRIQEIQVEADRVENLKRTALISLTNAENMKAEARDLVVNAQIYYDKVVDGATEALRELETRKRELDYRETDLNNREKSLVKNKKELSDRLIAVKDREESLARNFKRLNK